MLPKCHFCQKSYDYATFDFGPQYPRNPDESLMPAYLLDVGNVWICTKCQNDKAQSDKDRRLKVYEACEVYTSLYDWEQGIRCCLTMMDEQQNFSSKSWKRAKVWLTSCVPCLAYYQLLTRESDDALYYPIKPPEGPFDSQIFKDWFDGKNPRSRDQCK